MQPEEQLSLFPSTPSSEDRTPSQGDSSSQSKPLKVGSTAVEKVN